MSNSPEESVPVEPGDLSPAEPHPISNNSMVAPPDALTMIVPVTGVGQAGWVTVGPSTIGAAGAALMTTGFAE